MATTQPDQSQDMELEVDQYHASFEQLENEIGSADRIEDYRALLLNERVDDAAIKIKEQCIYR